ncbi:hypothetical protein FRB95_004417 [Tulasnella sp. JGI-2019a]|nr:hypothetical protein FRB93_003420 [Tulasnella sp. JGI-2019a]KAG9039945.1 hypothetical protein FRB95_004417 [Tulasnella sp. JGI-2019a]
MSAPNPQQPALDEQNVMNGFHSFLSNALAQAKAERLLEEEILASAESDIMVAGPALCLYFAALRSSTNPPSVPIPRSSAPGEPPLSLNPTTCPPAFRAYFSIWTAAVPLIQALPGDEQHDLARIICGREPLSPSTSRQDVLKRIAAELRSVAIEISQRRTFQERYQADLQAALDHGRPMSPDGRRTPSPLRATFVPPPGYEPEEKPLPSTPGGLVSSPTRSSHQYDRPPRSPYPGMHVVNQDAPTPYSPAITSSIPAVNGRAPSPAPASPRRTSTHAQPTIPVRGHTRNQSSSSQFLELPGANNNASGASGPSIRRSPSPTILTQQDPAILIIRETLYAALADVLARTPELRSMLKTDPSRAYFASVGLAILEVSLTSITPEGNVRAVLGTELKLGDAPQNYRPLMQELQRIGTRSRELEAEDDARAMELLSASDDALPEPRMDRVRKMLVKGVARGWEELHSDEEAGAMADAGQHSQRRREGGQRRGSRSQSPAGTALELTNRINALALGMTKLPAFKERQNSIFKVLASAR